MSYWRIPIDQERGKKSRGSTLISSVIYADFLVLNSLSLLKIAESGKRQYEIIS